MIVRLWLQSDAPALESGIGQLTQIVRVVIGERERVAKKGEASLS